MRKIALLGGAAFVAALSFGSPSFADDGYDDGDVDAQDFAYQMASGGYLKFKEAYDAGDYKRAGAIMDDEDDDDVGDVDDDDDDDD